MGVPRAFLVSSLCPFLQREGMTRLKSPANADPNSRFPSQNCGHTEYTISTACRVYSAEMVHRWRELDLELLVPDKNILFCF